MRTAGPSRTADRLFGRRSRLWPISRAAAETIGVGRAVVADRGVTCAASGKPRSKCATLRDVGRAEAVDRLVVVADHGHVAVRRREQLDEPVLRGVGVLVLVDEQRAEAMRQPLADLGELEQPDGPRDQVVEVERVRLARSRSYRDQTAASPASRSRDGGGCLEPRLRERDRVRGGPGVEPVAPVSDRLLDELAARAAVVDREAAAASGELRVAAGRAGARSRGTCPPGRCRPPSRPSRVTSSRAARFVNVMQRTDCGRVSSRASRAARRVRVRVLPAPGPARMSIGPGGAAIAAAWARVGAIAPGEGDGLAVASIWPPSRGAVRRRCQGRGVRVGVETVGVEL